MRDALKDGDERDSERLVTTRLLAGERARAGRNVGKWRTMLTQGRLTDMLQGLAELGLE